MRIIKPGNMRQLDPENVPCTCTACSCRFVFRASEARRIEDSRDGDYFRVACPECICLNSVDVRLRADKAAQTSGEGDA